MRTCLSKQSSQGKIILNYELGVRNEEASVHHCVYRSVELFRLFPINLKGVVQKHGWLSGGSCATWYLFVASALDRSKKPTLRRRKSKILLRRTQSSTAVAPMISGLGLCFTQ